MWASRARIMAGKFELYKSSNGEFRFRLKAGNGDHRHLRGLHLEGFGEERHRVREEQRCGC